MTYNEMKLKVCELRFGKIGLYCIYSGEWHSSSKKDNAGADLTNQEDTILNYY